MDSSSLPSLVACRGAACEEMRPVEFEETAGETILRVESVFLLKECVHIRISAPKIVGFHFAGVGEVKGAAVLCGEAY